MRYFKVSMNGGECKMRVSECIFVTIKLSIPQKGALIETPRQNLLDLKI